MSQPKKPKYSWFYRSGAGPLLCENGDLVLNICTYAGTPTIRLSLQVAYLDAPHEAIWRNGVKLGKTGPGWRYALSAWVGGGWHMISLEHAQTNDGISADSPAYLTRQEAIRAAIHEFVSACDKWLTTASDSSKPYRTHYGLISRPGMEQMAYYLCMPQWEPMWQLLEEVTRHDDWLNEIRAPKTAMFTEQLLLF